MVGDKFSTISAQSCKQEKRCEVEFGGVCLPDQRIYMVKWIDQITNQIRFLFIGLFQEVF